jgi:type IV secretory pathway VirD2 relaxase
MKIPDSKKEKIKFWKKKLKEYQEQYDKLRRQSPDRWWHDEHFDNQMRVLEEAIISTKQKLLELEKN